MAINVPISERKKPARMVSLVLSAMRSLGNGNGCTIRKIINYITDIGRRVAQKRQVIAALKRGVEFGIMNKRRGRYFLKSTTEPSLTRTFRKVVKKRMNQHQLRQKKAIVSRSIKRKLGRKKRRVNKLKPHSKLKRSLGKPAIKRLRKTRRLPTSKPYKFFNLYVNPSCRISAKSSVASTQCLEQEETENCT